MIVIVGGGAAGLATAIFLRQAAPSLRVRVLESARHPGAKILVSGGSRCNVTNRVVTERDFHGSTPAALGKLFPDSNRSRDVRCCAS